MKKENYSVKDCLLGHAFAFMCAGRGYGDCEICIHHIDFKSAPTANWYVATYTSEKTIQTKPKKVKKMKTKRFSDNIKFTYLYDDNKPVVTIASIEDDVEALYNYGIAYCSPEDQPCKSKGKELAVKRLEKYLADSSDKYAGTIEVPYITHHRINLQICNDIFVYKKYPQWAKDVVLQGIMDIAWKL